MTHPKIVFSKIAHSRQLKSLSTSPALILAMLIVMIVATRLATAQTFTILHSFDNTGLWPHAGLVQGLDGNLYGTTTSYGALNPSGIVFKISPRGRFTKLHAFDGTDGLWPFAGLVQSVEGNLYGTTTQGGPFGEGTVFRISTSGTLTTLYNFCQQSGCPDGRYTEAALVQATDGNFYGSTYEGGAKDLGTVFKMTPGGELTTLYSFCSQAGCADGEYPQGLVQAADGNFYGTTAGDEGLTSSGTVFKITAGGALTTLYRFCTQTNCTDGTTPLTALVQATDGNLYGTTSYGGTNNDGTIFKITSSGKLTVIYSFCSVSSCWDGFRPLGALIQATDGNFYGTTFAGGLSSIYPQAGGTVFQFTPSGELTTLYSFCSQPACIDGDQPLTELVQDTNGTFYGETRSGGAHGDGTVFRIAVGLGPFVRLVSTSAKVGTPIKILGQGFTGTPAVSFNGTAATFKVWSDKYLSATVPSGATTGPVTVTTPGGTLTSNHEFRVRPVILSLNLTSGPPGTPVVITGTSFTQATKVTFGGGKAKATFTVDSDTQVTANVPAGAPTGYIVLTTAGGKSRSPDTFAVTP